MEIAKVAHFLFYSSTEEFDHYTRKTLLRKMVITSLGSPEFTDTIEYNEIGKALVKVHTNIKEYCNNTSIHPTYRQRKMIELFNTLLYKPFPEGAIGYSLNFEPTITHNLSECTKTSPCKLCGECDRFEANYTEYTHSKKNCPYRYFYAILGILVNEDIDFYRFVLTLNRSANLYIKAKLDKLTTYKNSTDNLIENTKAEIREEGNLIIKDWNEKFNKKNTEYDEIKKELDLFHRIMPKDTIIERQENHMMMMEEQSQLKIEAEQKLLDANEAIEKLKQEQGMSEINIQMRAIKMQNMKHKFKTTINELDETIIMYEHNLALKTTKITNLIGEVNTLRRNMKLESEGYADMEKLNEKMYGMLKEQKKIPDENCSICMECIVDECMTLKCGHHFHSSCYMEYCLTKCRDDRYKKTYKCPNCRGEAVVLKNYNYNN